jgi:hypothetical protein
MDQLKIVDNLVEHIKSLCQHHKVVFGFYLVLLKIPDALSVEDYAPTFRQFIATLQPSLADNQYLALTNEGYLFFAEGTDKPSTYQIREIGDMLRSRIDVFFKTPSTKHWKITGRLFHNQQLDSDIQTNIDTLLLDPRKQSKTPKVSDPTVGPGTELQKIITKRLGQEAIAGCGCTSMINKMNKAGVKTCRIHIQHFTNRLVEIATKRKWVIEDLPEENVDPDKIGTEVPQTIRTRWARLFARITAKVPGGMSLIEWRCRCMVELAIRRAERSDPKRVQHNKLVRIVQRNAK